jgi:hypothetical protein
MTPKEKARELYNKMDQVTHGYVGSSMLSNTEFDEVKIGSTKAAAMVIVDELIRQTPSVYVTKDDKVDSGHSQYWEWVKQEIKWI